MLTGENGILTQARKAKEETENAQEEEEGIITDYENYISQYTNGGYVESKGVNAPVLKDNMKLVTFNEETKEWEENNSSSAYDYVAGEGTEDNNKSKWANARVTVDGIDSYFVWIPRYAYKITYSNPENKSEGGIINVKFLVGTSDNYYDENGELQKAKRAVTGHEDTTSDYYVHPVFTNNVDLGGWDSELTGIWIGKYESSRSDAGTTADNPGTSEKIAVVPGVTSWRNITIGDMYDYAKAYNTSLNSHMLKNSEWGAVAYLTESRYGRNGTEVTINDNNSYITADAGISANPDQSSTGNVYGIYDLRGGSAEYVASYLVNGNFLDANSTFTNNVSDEYSTAYTIEKGKAGDATYETGEWHGDDAYFVNSSNSFFRRGGYYYNGTNAGVFYFYNLNGTHNSGDGFRICLALN